MIDRNTLEECKRNNTVLNLKIKNLEHAIQESECIIKESKMNIQSLTFLRRKIADSLNDLEVLYLIKNELG